MRTRVEVDESLLLKAVRLTGAKSRRAAVDIALRELVKNPAVLKRAAVETVDYSGILALEGKGMIDPDYDPKNPAGLLPARLDK